MDRSASAASNQTENATVSEREPQVRPSQCRICGAPASYAYFGVISCMTCKVFFKRNASKGLSKLRCHFDGDCEITILSRHTCAYCRLKKCFDLGMNTDRIRGPLPEKSRRTKKTNANVNETTSPALVRRMEPSQIRTVNILQADQSGLTSKQWSLLSNLVQCYDEHSGIEFCRNFITSQESLPPKFRYKSEAVADFLLKTMNGSEKLFQKNQDFLSLCAQDRSTLIRMTFQLVSCITSNFIQSQIGTFDRPGFYDSAVVCFGEEIMGAGRRCFELLDFDLTFMKVMLVLLAFSTTTSATTFDQSMGYLSDIKAVLAIQDSYAEIVWKYLLYKYNHQQSVQWLCRFMRMILLTIDLTVKADQSKRYTDAVSSLVEETERSLDLSE